jgi:NAD(P)-dependent dehydrogenase (short-subunit alcohol dehydrogenase family)
MDELRFNGRTAIVTGAGGNPSLGRAHALLLAARGANVVVNDVGRSEAPNYPGVASAKAVVEEIRAMGGKAVADTHSVATEDGSRAIVQAAVDAFGGVDILVNNAAVSIAVPFDEMTSRDTQRHIDINLMGSIWMCRAVWPLLRAKGYGRIINIGSGAFTGMWAFTIYGASKGGIFSLTRGLAEEGAPFGIRVNTVNPGAYTRMLLAQQDERSTMFQHAKTNLQPELVSPLIAYLAHESCPVSGECFDCMGGQVRRVYVAHTEGFVDRDLTVESIARRWAEVMGDPPVSMVGLGAVDTRQWSIRPYPGERRAESA